MQTEPTGQSGQVTSSLTESIRKQGSHNLRQVSEQQDLEKQLTHTPPETTFQTLKQRGITPKSLSGGSVSTIANVLTPLALMGMDSSSKKTRKLIKKNLEDSKAGQSRDSKRLNAARKELTKVNSQLVRLRVSLGAMSAKQMQNYQTALKASIGLNREIAELEARDSWSTTRQQLLQKDLEQFNHKTDQTRQLTEAAAYAGAKFIGGLRQVYQSDPSEKASEKVRLMKLGDLKMADQDHYEVSVQDLGVAIETFHRNEDGTVTLHIAECSGRCTALNKNGDVTGPVRLNGGMKVVIKEPLAELVDQLMKCSLLKLPFRVQGMTEEFDKRAKKVIQDLNGKKPEMQDYIDFEVSALNIDDEETQQVNSILSRQGVNIILELLNPVVSSFKGMADDQLQTRMSTQSATLTFEAEKRRNQIGRFEEVIHQLEDDIAHVSSDDSHSALKAELIKTLEELKQEKQLASTKQNENDEVNKIYKSLIAVNDKWRKSDRNEWVEGYTNLANAFLTLRDAESHATEADPVVLKCPMQRIPIGRFAHLDVEGMEAAITGVELDESGNLTISIPEMKGRLLFENDVSGDSRVFPVSLKGGQIRVMSPLGTFIRDTLKLDFPLDVRRVQKLSAMLSDLWPAEDQTKARSAATTKGKDPRIDELLQLNFGDVMLVRDGEEYCSESYEVDPEELAKTSTQLLGGEVKAGSFEEVIGKLFKPETLEFRKLMHFLAMSVLGVQGEQRAPDTSEIVLEPEEDALSVSSSSGDSGVVSDFDSDSELETTHVETLPISEVSVVEELVSIETLLDEPSEVLVEPVKVSEITLQEHESIASTVKAPIEKEPEVRVDETATLFEEEAVHVTTEVMEALTVEELRSAEGLSDNPSFILDTDNTAKAVFELKTNLDQLFGKLSWFWKFLMGSSADLEVMVPKTKRGVELGNPIVRLKKAGAIRRFAVNRLLKSAMKKRRVTLAVDYSGEKKRIGLVLDDFSPRVTKH
ncbi:hypothetical protein [Endozoicomonas arenosclerae]|uniref:hypothetical protein n=1 Tax=Endozoicomonas arenosclerae TaxID=1633495 RepID=UPI000A41D3FC|nr:hypothetical protein [Endozoicomonas arenosclerae]